MVETGVVAPRNNDDTSVINNIVNNIAAILPNHSLIHITYNGIQFFMVKTGVVAPKTRSKLVY